MTVRKVFSVKIKVVDIFKLLLIKPKTMKKNLLSILIISEFSVNAQIIDVTEK